MADIWVLVADSSRARFFRATSPAGGLEELEDMTDPLVRMPERELGSDKPGRAFDRAGQGRHAMGKEVSFREEEIQAFARELAHHLREAREAGRYEGLVIAAPPAFLGELRKQIDPQTAAKVHAEVDKDLVKMEVAEIRERLPERL